MDKKIHREWLEANGDSTLRLDYDLREDSPVLDVGGYQGKWAESIFNRYKCRVQIFEPIRSLYEGICSKYESNDKISVYNYGLSNKDELLDIHVNEASKDGSSFFISGGTIESVSLRSAADIIRDIPETIDLMKINVEGSEFEILPDILDAGLQNKIKNIQIQFHNISESSESDREAIREKLSETHRETYCYKFVWENWELKGGKSD